MFLLLAIPACATVQKPLIGIIPGREVETLQSSINMTVSSGEHSMSGHGFLVFKRPDRFHMAFLSPFGLTVLEVFIDKGRLTCLVPSRQTAYSGLLSELPETSGFKSLSRLEWVVEPPPAADGNKELTTASGDRFYFDAQGLVTRKVSTQGDVVTYENYDNVNGVAFPQSLLVENSYGAKVKIVFDEPEINTPVEDSVLLPNLEGIPVLPLADFKGF